MGMLNALIAAKAIDPKVTSYNPSPKPVNQTLTGATSAPAPSSTQSAQDWINNSASGMGGVDAYTKMQNDKLTTATNNNDVAMLDKLKADSARTGLNYTVNQPTPSNTVQQPQQQSNSNADLINSMYQNNLAAQQQAFEKQRQIQQQGLNGQETSVNQNALQNLNNNDAMANQQLKSLQEVMANNGVRGGDSITATIGNQTAQQNGANAINQDKANQLRSIMEQRSLIDNNAAGDNTALIQKLQAARDGQLLDNTYKQQDYGLNLAQLLGRTSDGQQTLAGQNQGFNQNLATNQYNQSVKNDTFNQGMANKQFDYQKVQDDIKNGQWTTQTENQMKQWAEGNKLDWSKFGQETKNALAQIAISQQNANTNAYQASTSAANQANDNALQLKKFNYDSDKNNIDNLYKQSQIDKNTADSKKSGLDDAYYKAVALAQKDPLFNQKSADEQASIINTHYQNLKPKDAVSDSDISQYLKK